MKTNSNLKLVKFFRYFIHAQSGNHLVLAVALLSGVTQVSTARTINVPDDYETLQAGIDAAEEGDTVLVQPGVYPETVSIETPNIVVGSLILSENNPEFIANTIIDGEQRRCCLNVDAGDNPRGLVRGFTIIDGAHAVEGTGIWTTNGTFEDLIITGCVTEEMLYGGAVHVDDRCTARFVRCKVIGNGFRENHNYSRRGGGVTVGRYIGNGAVAIFIDSEISDNHAISGGGVYLFDQSVLIATRTLIARNEAHGGLGGGILFNNNTSAELINTTIFGNVSTNENDAAMNGNSRRITISNSIVYGNGIPSMSVNGTVTIDYSDVEGERDAITGQAQVDYQETNIDSDPLFLDPDNGDFHLQVNSPCIDAGDPESELDPDGTRADMGAFYVRHVFHRIPLRQGWNMLSSFNQPRNASMVDVWSNVAGRGNLIFVKNQSGQFYIPGEFNGMPEWDVRQGYLAKVAQSDTLTIVDVPADVRTPIPLRQGWNIISYFPEQDLDVRDALACVVDDVILVKDLNGRFYLPLTDFSNMPPLTRGRGYQVAVREACELIYPEEQMMMSDDDGNGDGDGDANADGDASRSQSCAADRRTAVTSPQVTEGSENAFTDRAVTADFSHFHPIEMTGANMSVLVNVEFGMRNGEYEIGVFTANGVCVGAASLGGQASLPVRNRKSTHREQAETPILLTGIAIWADDPTTHEIDGAVGGEPLSFRLWDGIAESSVVPTAVGTTETVFETDGYAEITLDLGAQGPAPLPTALSLEEPYPNPFNSITNIHYSLPKASSVKLTVFDLSGREVATLANGYRLAGVHDVVWSADGVGSGIYIVRLEDGAKTTTQKVLLVK